MRKKKKIECEFTGHCKSLGKCRQKISDKKFIYTIPKERCPFGMWREE